MSGDERRGLGWIPQLPDQRDRRFRADPAVLSNLPESADLRSGFGPVWDQGQIGSCTAHAAAGLVSFDRRRQGLPDWTPSRLFIYYQERVLEGTVASDAGAMIRDGIKSINTVGVPPEDLWPYDIGQLTVAPGQDAFAEAVKHEAVQYEAVEQTLDQMKACLASGFPFAIGVSVYQSFFQQSGIIPLPAPEESLEGGHAIIYCGYTPTEWIWRNSWGPEWGQNGYGTMPLEYGVNPDLASDLWKVTVMSG